MACNRLLEWLAFIETLHPLPMELGLERVAQVWRKMGPPQLPFTTVTVAGTNGKGSTVALLEAVLGAQGYRVGAYTSPHLLRYNERVRLGGVEVEDALLCRAFARVEQVREAIPLTYFEFGTLAALDLFVHSGVDVALLEVGLGGRLDAVNLVDADVSVLTSVALDHTDWLGPTRETIGAEKAGIFRHGRPAICGDEQPPRSVRACAERLGATWYGLGEQFGYRVEAGGWTWWAGAQQLCGLPVPYLGTDNAATVLMALSCLGERLPVGRPAIESGFADARLPGRFQVLPGPVTCILDVAHNPAAAARLAMRLDATHCVGVTHAVVAMLADKDLCGTLAPLLPRVDKWFVAGLSVRRGAPAERLAACFNGPDAGARRRVFADVGSAYAAAMREATAGGRVLVFGSFHTVAEALEHGL